MIADGRAALAASTLRWAKSRFRGSEALDRSERLAYLKRRPHDSIPLTLFDGYATRARRSPWV
jgi:hypothetical protein